MKVKTWRSGVLFSAVLFGLLAGPIAAAETYEVDPMHTQILFKVKHLGISTVTGSFKKFQGAIQYDPKNVEKSSVEVTIDTASIDTGIEKRDEHLRSSDFFDVKKYPAATFKSTKIKKVGKGKLAVEGDLTLKGVTKKVMLEVQEGGRAKDPWGNERIAFEAKTALDRKDFGITWNKKLDTGGLVVSEEVKIEIHLEAILKK